MLSDDDDDNLVKSTDNFSVRYDKSNDIYYCFYHENEYFHSELILSYDVKTRRWSVETSEYQNVFEEKFNERFQHSNQTFEEQIELIRDGLDTYFSDKSQQRKSKTNQQTQPFAWFRNFSGMHRSASQDMLATKSRVMPRYSVPENAHDLSRERTATNSSIVDHPFYARPPFIKEIWLNLTTDKMNEFRKKLGNRKSEEKLQKLAEKFVTYFGGTFQCDVGQEYQLSHNLEKWYFIILKVEFTPCETMKPLRTKIIFIIDSLPHYVRN